MLLFSKPKFFSQRQVERKFRASNPWYPSPSPALHSFLTKVSYLWLEQVWSLEGLEELCTKMTFPWPEEILMRIHIEWNVIPFSRVVFLIHNTDVCQNWLPLPLVRFNASCISAQHPVSVPIWVIHEAESIAVSGGGLGDLHFMGCYIRAEHGSLGFCDARKICQRRIGMCSHSRWKGKRVSHSARMWFHPQSLQSGYIWSSTLELCGSKNGRDL